MDTDAARSVRRGVRLRRPRAVAGHSASAAAAASDRRARHRGRRSDRFRCGIAVSRRSAAAGSRARFVGITGTNGKSTTTALLAHILKAAGRERRGGRQSRPGRLVAAAAAGRRHLCAGNVVLHVGATRIPFASMRRRCSISARTISTAMATWRATHWRSGRSSIARPRHDLAVIGVEDADLARHGRLAATRAGQGGPVSGVRHARMCSARTACCATRRARSCTWRDAVALPGAHNAQNAAAAAAMAFVPGRVARPRSRAASPSYPGLPHRQQRIVDDRRHHFHQRQQGDQRRLRRRGADLLRPADLDRRRHGRRRAASSRWRRISRASRARC